MYYLYMYNRKQINCQYAGGKSRDGDSILSAFSSVITDQPIVERLPSYRINQRSTLQRM